LTETGADFAVVVDSSPTGLNNQTVRDFAYCSRGDDRGLFGTPVLLKHMDGEARSTFESPAASPVAAQGRWIGMLKISCRGLVQFNAVLRALRLRPDFDTLDLPALLNALIADGAAIEVIYVHGHWRGVNDLEDFRRAGDFAHAQSPSGGDRD
jgi:phosphoenolpyruvate phosphomutase